MNETVQVRTLRTQRSYLDVRYFFAHRVSPIEHPEAAAGQGASGLADCVHDEMRLYVPEPRPKLKITGETVAAHCRIAEAGDYTYIELITIKSSPWTRLAKKGHEIWWEFHRDGDRRYTGRLIIDDQLYTVSEAKKRPSRSTVVRCRRIV